MIYDKYEASSIRCFRSPPVAAAKAAWRSGKGRVAIPWPWSFGVLWSSLDP